MTEELYQDGCICEGNWRQIIKESYSDIGKWYHSSYDNKDYKLFGIVWADDDFYYGMCDKDSKTILVTCCSYLKNQGFILNENSP